MSVKPTIVELILNATAAGKSMLSAANAAAQKTLLSLVKGDVGLGNVDNTSDANKPVSTAQQTALDAKADLVGGVVPSAQIPAIAITEYLGSVANQAAMLALTGDRGDWCLRSDTGTTFVLSDDDSSLLASWVELNYPTAPVTSVNGETGAVTLSASDVGAAATSHTHAQSDITDLTTDLAGKAAAAIMITAGTGLSGGGDLSANRTIDLEDTAVTPGSYTAADITVDAQGRITAAANGSGGSGIGGSVGSDDNVVPRSDGTGGTTLQASAIAIDDLATASPNNTVNVVCLKPNGGTTNVGIVIAAKGTGSITAQVPDATVTNGDARGASATDWQRERFSLASKVASGTASAIGGGSSNTASGIYSTVPGGFGSTASGQCSIAHGNWAVASGSYSVAMGAGAVASGSVSIALGSGTASAVYGMAFGGGSLSDRYGQLSHNGGSFAADGDAQWTVLCVRKKTTDATPVTLTLDGASTRLTIPSGKLLVANVLVSGIKSDGSAVAAYKRKVAIKNVGGTTALVGSVETIGTDIEDNASTDVTITADNTNDALDISVTGIAAETWRWVAIVEGLEIVYGT